MYLHIAIGTKYVHICRKQFACEAHATLTSNFVKLLQCTGQDDNNQ